MEPRTFADGVLGGRESVKGFRVVATDGSAGRVSWASYAPGESYLVVTLGLLSKKHHVIPAGAVTAVSDGEVRVGLTRDQIKRLPDLPHPESTRGGADVGTDAECLRTRVRARVAQPRRILSWATLT